MSLASATTTSSSASRTLTAGYDDVAILEDINFEVRRGEVFGILGGSGGGKSTLMKHMIGLLPPLAGTSCTSTATTS